ncbi:metalloregulator ArsR/SmtB family transcription factor [bacterium]|nr:metalloregulator ArsR/SmtB family transcription factor [bacterium]
MKDENLYKKRAEVIKAMAHPSRLLMIDALSYGEKCVFELQELVGDDISTVSKHLSVMKKAGIVDCRKDGLKVFYRLKVPCILNFFSCIEAVIENEKKYVCTMNGAKEV